MDISSSFCEYMVVTLIINLAVYFEPHFWPNSNCTKLFVKLQFFFKEILCQTSAFDFVGKFFTISNEILPISLRTVGRTKELFVDSTEKRSPVHNFFKCPYLGLFKCKNRQTYPHVARTSYLLTYLVQGGSALWNTLITLVGCFKERE